MPEDEIEGDDDIYSEDVREDLVDSGAMSPEEAGFMAGAHDDGQGAKCRKCGRPLSDDFIERRGDDSEIYRFCSDECCEEYFNKKD
ncbi:MAG: hypothetical protein ABIJ08_02430 [Nanoarchaeota archaeon]